MGGSLRQLTSRQLEQLKSELAEVIIANFCYPAFLDYRLNALRTRPVDRRKRQEVWGYVNSVNFGPLGTMDAASLDFRRFVERVFLRYIDLNRPLVAMASARQVAAARARVPQLALSMARGLADYLTLSEASVFGRARVVESWGATRDGLREPTWEQIEKSTQVLQTTLVYLRTTGAEKAVSAGGARLDRAVSADISMFPTRLLNPAHAEQRLASAGASNGSPASHYDAPVGHDANNGSHNGREEGARFSSPPADATPAARTTFQGPSRLPTISRPIDREQALPPAVPPGGAPVEPKETPALPVQPALTPQPPPAPQPTTVPQAEAAADAWQALLPRAETAQPSAVTGGSAASAPADQPEFDLPDLPESFGTPRSLDLPPDLAELYGDYLRDSRSDALDLMPVAQAAQTVSSLPEPVAVSLPPGETDEEVDALFTALTSHISAQEQAISATTAPQQVGPEARADGRPSGAGPQEPGAVRRTAEEPSPAPRVSTPLPEQRGGSRGPGSEDQNRSGAPARGMTDGDVMIFAQLQHQISTWVKMAAVSHQIDLVGRDAPELVAELRRTAALEEAELQVIESLVSLCHRVTTTKQATVEDYKQAMMLYLLHHRSRLAL